MDNKKREVFALPKAGLYLAVMFVFATTTLFLNYKVAVAFYMIWLVLLTYNWRFSSLREKELTKYIEDLSLNISNATNGTMRDFPLPLSVIQLDGKIVWYNPSFKNMLSGEKLFDRNINDLIEKISPEELLKTRVNLNTEVKDVEVNGRIYDVYGTIVKTEKKTDLDDYILIIYFMDKTDLIMLEQKYHDEKTAVGIIMIDNYDELMQNIDEYQKSQMQASFESTVTDWFSACNGILRKYERDKYFFMFESRYMGWLIEKRFEILDTIRELPTGCEFPITVSMGFGIRNGSLPQNFDAAKASIDVALGRGGDQVVIQDDSNYRFYGGKTREIEKRTKVKSRVVSGVLKDLISHAGDVLVMGHDNSDLDSLGASIGIHKLGMLCDKKVHIVIGNVTQSIRKFYSEFDNEPEYTGVFLDKEEALSRVNGETLLIIVDTHKPTLTVCPELLEKCQKIVVIDHHRRGADFIQNTTISYQEPYASSTCELVTEILIYADERLHLTKLQAEALYAGIVVDTKNFTFKTGVRTFEAAAYLKRYGADTSNVKNYFAQDLEMYINLANIVKSAKLVDGGIAVATCPANLTESQLTAATAADQLVNLTGINAAFVLAESDGVIHISGRSYGDINVQMVLEKLGGGGHQTVAGAQVEDKTMDEVIELLYDAIKQQNDMNAG